MESSVVTGGGTKAKDPEGLSEMVRMRAKGPEGRRRGSQRWGSPPCISVLDLPQVSELRSGNINKGHGEEIPEGAAVTPPSSPANMQQKPLALGHVPIAGACGSSLSQEPPFSLHCHYTPNGDPCFSFGLPRHA